MFANLVKNVTIACPECNTSIKFDIRPGNNEITDLFRAISNLECPKCKASLASDTQDIVRAIHEYNSAALKLSDTARATGAKLD